MKSVLNLCLTLLLSLVLISGAFANGLSLNSIGPKALGMGGAFVGLANDGTAIYWNPAGLSGQNSSLLIFGTDIIPFSTYKTPDGTPAPFALDLEAKTNHYISPNLFAVYNMDKLTLGFGAFVPAGLGVEWDKDALGGIEYMSRIGVFNFSPAIAYQLSDQFSIGLAVNIAYGFMEMKRESGGEQYTEDPSGWGFGATVGLKLAASEQLDLGLTVRTPTNVSFEGDALTGALDMELKRDIEWPLWIGFGLAYEVCDCWVITADAQYSNWSSLETLETEYSFTHPLAGPMTMKDTTDLKWENAVQIA
jgi:long-chain fatty acid transport protein